MAFSIPKQSYSGKIGETTIGKGKKAVTIGGADAYSFHLFEGKMPNPPKIAMEIWDYDPSKDWPEAAIVPFKDVISSPENWAKKCVKEYGAEIIVLQLKSIDPNGMNRGAAEASDVAKKVIEAVDVPVILWGTANNQKDEEVLKLISEKCQGKNISMSPVEEGNHKGIGASAIAYGHTIVASTPIDVNLAKQLNILIGNLGVPRERTLIDPTTGGLGYGLEYSYSVMERIRMAALTQEDEKLQAPMINNVGNEIWKCKEAGAKIEDAPTLGDPERRAITMECVAAVSYLLAGSDVVILRHPESVRMVRSFINLMVKGGSAKEVKGINKLLKPKEIDLAAIAPKPDLTVKKEVKAEAKKEPVKEAPKAQKPAEKPKAAPATAPKAKEEKVIELKPKESKEATLKAQAEADAGAKIEAEIKAKAAAEAKAKEDAEAKARAEAEAKAQAGLAAQARKEAKAKADAKEKDELQALRFKRAQEKEKQAAVKHAPKKKAGSKTAATLQLNFVDKLIRNLDRIHRRDF